MSKNSNSNLRTNEERLSNLQNELILHFHQDAVFYERRTYIIFFVISGFGLYACLDLYKELIIKDYILLLLISSGLFLIPLLLSIISNEIARKKSIYKADYFQNLKEIDRKGAGKYIKIENGLKLTIGICYFIGVILLVILYYINFIEI